MTRDTLWLGRAYEFVRYYWATGDWSDIWLQIRTRWLGFFYHKWMAGQLRPGFCCLQCHIISYVHSYHTASWCRRVVLPLHSTPYGMLRLLLAVLVPVSLRCSCYYCSSCTTAQLLLMLLLLFLSVFSYFKNHSRPTKKSLLWERIGVLPKWWICVPRTCVHACIWRIPVGNAPPRCIPKSVIGMIARNLLYSSWSFGYDRMLFCCSTAEALIARYLFCRSVLSS